MDDLLEKLKCNWELAVVAGVVLFAAIILGAHFLLGNNKDIDDLNASGTIEASSMLSEHALDFLTKKPDGVNDNPFKLPIKPPETPKPKPKPKQEPQNISRPAPLPKTEPIQEPQEEIKPPEPEFTQAIAQFVMKGNIAARPMAIIRIKTPDGNSENLKMGIGDTKYEMKLLSIENEQIELQDAKGTKGSIPMGKAKRLYIKK